MSHRWRGAGAFALRWLFFLACLVAWQWAATRINVTAFPTPTEVLRAAREQWLSGPPSHLFLTDSVRVDVLSSLGKLLAGWLVCALAGVVLGMLIGLSTVVSDYTSAVLGFGRALPPVMLAPVFLTLFHIGTQMQLATIVFGAVWPVLLNTVDGARSVDPLTTDTVRAFRVGRIRWVFQVVFPAALPKIFAGLRVSLGLALILLVLSEMVGGGSGLGYVVNEAGLTFQFSLMWAGIMVVCVVGYGFNRLLLLAEHRMLGWHRGAKRLTEE